MKVGIEHNPAIEQLIEPMLNDLGFDLVVARMIGGARRTLQVMAEPRDRERIMTVEDCAEISHAVSAVLDVADPVPGRYSLEVSSPGLDRPLVRAADYERFAGEVARVEIEGEIGGRKRFKGRLAGLVGGRMVRMQLERGEELELPIERIRKARLEVTDEVIAAATRRARTAGRDSEEAGHGTGHGRRAAR